jgi:outer membrane protein assembly factor BamB
MSNSRRFCVVIGSMVAVAAAVVLLSVEEGRAQVGGQQIGAHGGVITLPTDRKAQQVMQKGQELIEEKEWNKAVEALQYLLNTPEDGFVQITREGPGKAPITLWVSIRSEANRLLGTMAGEGLKVYEDMYGREAGNRLTEARERNDIQLLADVAQRYLHTKAGAKAAELLGTRSLERDEPMMAALYFERLITGPRGAELETPVLVKAALASYRAGDKASGDEAWKLISTRAKRDGGVKIGEDMLPAEQVRAELDKVTQDEPRSTREWHYYRGSPSRNSQGIGGPVTGEPSWVQSTLLPRGDSRAWIEELVNGALGQVEQKPQLCMPAFHPLTVADLAIYRTYDRVFAVYLKDTEVDDGKEKRTMKAGEFAWWSYTDGGAENILGDPSRKTTMDSWKNYYKPPQGGPPSAVFESSVTGTLSTDGLRVYAVDDLILQPHPVNTNMARMGFMGQNNNVGALQKQVEVRNTLKAYNLKLDGALRWELGGEHDPYEEKPGKPGTKDSFFLGPPLPMGDKLYVLNEKEGALRLICLRPRDGTEKNPQAPEILWTQILANAKDKISLDFHRRMHAAHISYGEGILVCATNAGVVLGVDLLTHSLVWAHQYREPEPPVDPKKNRPIFNGGQPQNLNLLTKDWKATAPVVIDGRVVLTAPDSQSIHCLNLRDGRQIWGSQPQHKKADDDYYFGGVFQGKVLIVGKNYVRALNLTDGKEAWKIGNTGIPSGQGAAANNVYYLPVRATADTKEPAIVAIDLAKAAIVSTTKVAKRGNDRPEVPGNLVFFEGQLIAHGLTSIVCFPPEKAAENKQKP